MIWVKVFSWTFVILIIALVFNQAFGWINIDFVSSKYSEKCYIKGQEPANMKEENKIYFEGISGYLKCKRFIQ